MPPDLNPLFSLATLIIVPLMLWNYQRNITRRDEAEQKQMEEWHQSVEGKIIDVSQKITTLCRENHDEHEEFYKSKNKHEKQLERIETIHLIKGCAAPPAQKRQDRP